MKDKTSIRLEKKMLRVNNPVLTAEIKHCRRQYDGKGFYLPAY